MPNNQYSVILLDAMGVLYKSGDDVGELLVPFIGEQGSTVETKHIEEVYRLASLGKLEAEEFWRSVGLSSELEDKYLLRHTLFPGLLEFLNWAKATGIRICCLSNDVSPWSVKLRQRFGLDTFIDDWIISGDVGLRKPDPRIYSLTINRLGVAPGRILFVDDRPANIYAALAAGMQGVIFLASPPSLQNDVVPNRATFNELRNFILDGNCIVG